MTNPSETPTPPVDTTVAALQLGTAERRAAYSLIAVDRSGDYRLDEYRHLAKIISPGADRP